MRNQRPVHQKIRLVMETHCERYRDIVLRPALADIETVERELLALFEDQLKSGCRATEAEDFLENLKKVQQAKLLLLERLSSSENALGGF